jgi:hypothetical protein
VQVAKTPDGGAAELLLIFAQVSVVRAIPYFDFQDKVHFGIRYKYKGITGFFFV